MTAELRLPYETEVMLYPCPPFHFDGTVYKPSYFPGPDLVYETGHVWHSLRFEDQLFGVRMDNMGSIDAPAVRLVIFSEKPLDPGRVERISGEMAVRYDLFSDLRSFYDAALQDDLLAPAAERWRGMRPSSYSSLYEYLVIATVLQNATIRRSIQMMNNLFERFGTPLRFDGRVLAGFWSPEDIQAASEDELRQLKLGYRAKTLKRQAESFDRDGSSAERKPVLDEQYLRSLETPDLKRALLTIYGIGQASVWYLLFGQFRRYDAFDYISPWEQKIFSRLLFDQELVEAQVILKEVERRWGSGPFAGKKMLAAHILFEDLFWQWRNQQVPWLDELIRR